MNYKKSLGIFLCLAGVGLGVLSNYIDVQVEEGKVKISIAQRQVSQGKKLFSNDPVTKQFGNAVFSGAQRKIDEGSQEISQYEQIASWMQFGAIACIVIGAGLIFMSKKRK